MAEVLPLPKSVYSSELTICGITLRCHVLDDGRRVFEPEGLAQLFGGEAVGMLSGEDADELTRFIRGEQP